MKLHHSLFETWDLNLRVFSVMRLQKRYLLFKVSFEIVGNVQFYPSRLQQKECQKLESKPLHRFSLNFVGSEKIPTSRSSEKFTLIGHWLIINYLKWKYILSPQEKRQGPQFKVASERLSPEIWHTNTATHSNTNRAQQRLTWLWIDSWPEPRI